MSTAILHTNPAVMSLMKQRVKPGAPLQGSQAPAGYGLLPAAAGDLYMPRREETISPSLQERGRACLAPELRPSAYRIGPKDLVCIAAKPALLGGLNGAIASIPVIGVPLSALFGGLLANATADMLQQKSVEPPDHQKVLNKVMAVGGAAALGAAAFVAPPLAVAGIWGGTTAMVTLALTAPEAVENKKYQADEDARSGRFRTASLFRQAYKEKGEENILLHAEVRAAEELEKAGWTLGATRGDYRNHVRGGDAYVRVAAPGNKDGSAMGSFDIKLLPTLAVLICGTGSGLEGDRHLIDTVHTLQKWEQRGVNLTPQNVDSRYLEMAKGGDTGRLLNMVNVAMDLINRRDVQYSFGNNRDLNLPAPGPEGLDTFMERLSRLVAASREHEVLFNSLSCYQPLGYRTQALTSLLKELPDEEFSRGLQVLGELSACAQAHRKWGGGYSDILKDYDILMTARDAGEPLEKSASDYKDLLSAFAAANRADSAAFAYANIRRSFKEGAIAPGEQMAEHVAAVIELARCVKDATPRGDISTDYKTLMAERDRTMPLEKSAAEYCELLSGLASVNRAREAAPTYAFLRRGIAGNEFGSSDFHELCVQLMTDLLNGESLDEARNGLRRRVGAKGESSLEEEDGFLIIDGMKMPIQTGEKYSIPSGGRS